MIGRFFIFSFLIPFALSGSPEHGSWRLDAKSRIVFPFHAKPDSVATFFYSIGTEWLNFYCYGQTSDGFWNYSSAFLPSSLNMEFRKNVLERDRNHSCSIAFAPQAGFAILAT
ncbi:MAG TPA: hypothetical protein VFJ43_04565, partial [Bacteroidia bacterium]|nr:hypothetical protein [Bacteroidia bacterium]